jgi:hypothetical protein
MAVIWRLRMRKFLLMRMKGGYASGLLIVREGLWSIVSRYPRYPEMLVLSNLKIHLHLCRQSCRAPLRKRFAVCQTKA